MRKYVLQFEVVGRLAFPVDMLRYDACHPARGEDAGEIEASMRHDERGREFRVRLRSWVERRLAIPSERWSSFGWIVDPSSIYVE